MSQTAPKKTKTLSIIIVVCTCLLTPALLLAEGYGLSDTAQFAGLKTSSSLPVVIGHVIFYLLGFLGAVFFVLIVYGGFTWMTARGNKEDVTKAQGIITSAAIGLAVVLASYAITSFIISRVISSTGIGEVGSCSCKTDQAACSAIGGTSNTTGTGCAASPCSGSEVCCCQ